LTYSYPDTKHESRDLGEINSLKISQKYNIPIFVLLGLKDDRSKKEICNYLLWCLAQEMNG
jgi:hypothetical protein